MRNCKNCVYAKWMGKKVYCMFFSSPSCPKGKSMALNFSDKPYVPEPVVKKDEKIYPPPFKVCKDMKVKSVLRDNHYEIYKMRYEDNMLFKDIASKVGVTSSAIMSYMTRCDRDYIEAGNKEWADFLERIKQDELKQDGLTAAGNIPPYKVSSKFSTRAKNSPLRLHHDEIFNMRKEGYTFTEIADKLGLIVSSLYAYVERCENEWANRQQQGE